MAWSRATARRLASRAGVPTFSSVRIALVSTPFVSVPPRTYGGTELVVHELVRGLSRAGHDVVLFATGDSEGPDVRWLYDRPMWPPDPDVELLHCRAAAHVIAHERFDVVHAHAPSFLAFEEELGAPLVYTVHHARDEELLRRYIRSPRVHYVAISGRQARLSPEVRAHVIHHGLDSEHFPPGRGEGDYALFIGRLSWCKGPDVALEAARLAGLELVVAGGIHAEPEDPPGWHEWISRALAAPGVRRVGTVGGQRKLRLLGAARVLVMPIRWEEPFGLVMIEAMLSGTPVVAFRRGAAPEIVEDGLTGFLVDDAAEMAHALERARGLPREPCRRRARERFSAVRMVRDHLRLYERLLDVSPRFGRAEEWSHAG
jgi:glycosyltransferase involved in cell wall biosynthesis